MLKQIVIAALLFAGLSGCKSKSAFKYSENIIAKEKSLLPDISATEKKVEKYIRAEYISR